MDRVVNEMCSIGFLEIIHLLYGKFHSVKISTELAGACFYRCHFLLMSDKHQPESGDKTDSEDRPSEDNSTADQRLVVDRPLGKRRIRNVLALQEEAMYLKQTFPENEDLFVKALCSYAHGGKKKIHIRTNDNDREIERELMIQLGFAKICADCWIAAICGWSEDDPLFISLRMKMQHELVNPQLIQRILTIFHDKGADDVFVDLIHGMLVLNMNNTDNEVVKTKLSEVRNQLYTEFSDAHNAAIYSFRVVLSKDNDEEEVFNSLKLFEEPSEYDYLLFDI